MVGYVWFCCIDAEAEWRGGGRGCRGRGGGVLVRGIVVGSARCFVFVVFVGFFVFVFFISCRILRYLFCGGGVTAC
jgi:hypothetical protein